MRRPTSAWTTAILGTALSATTLTVSAQPSPATGDRSSSPAVAAVPVSGMGTSAGSARALLDSGWGFLTRKTPDPARALAQLRAAELRAAELSPADQARLRQGLTAARSRLGAVALTDPALQRASGALARPALTLTPAPAGRPIPAVLPDMPAVPTGPAVLSASPSPQPAPVSPSPTPAAPSRDLLPPSSPAVAASTPAEPEALPPGPGIPPAPAAGLETLPPLPDLPDLPAAPPVAPPNDAEATPAAASSAAAAPPPVAEPLPPLPDMPDQPAPAPPAADPVPVPAPPAELPPPQAVPVPEPAPAPAPVPAPVPAPEIREIPSNPAPTAREPEPVRTAQAPRRELRAPAPVPGATPTPAPNVVPPPPAPPASEVSTGPDSASASASASGSEPNLIPDGFDPKRSLLPPHLEREVERMAEKQEAEAKQNEMQARPIGGPEGPPMAAPTGGPTSSASRLDINRAPSPTEARPIRAIPVPEEFVPMVKRDWAPNRKYWAAANTCHYPLYFQDAMLERYGRSVEQVVGPYGRCLTYPLDDPKQSTQRNQIAQPFFSAGLFALQAALLPWNLIMDPPWESENDLGYWRPGDRIPTDLYYLPRTGVGPPLHGNRY